MAFYAGLALAISRGERIGGFPLQFAELGQERLLGLPTQWWMMLAVAVAAWVVVQHTRFGRYLFAMGDNRRTAIFAAVPVKRLEWTLYAASGLVAGVVAVFYTARSEAAIPTAGQGQELSAIACVIVGGTARHWWVWGRRADIAGDRRLSAFRYRIAIRRIAGNHTALERSTMAAECRKSAGDSGGIGDRDGGLERTRRRSGTLSGGSSDWETTRIYVETIVGWRHAVFVGHSGDGHRWFAVGRLRCEERISVGRKRLKIGMMPKLVGIAYFNACERGAGGCQGTGSRTGLRWTGGRPCGGAGQDCRSLDRAGL